MTISRLGDLRLQNYQPLRDVVFEHLRNAILNGNLKPSERLMEVQIAEQLGVSRTPVREAIRKLELEGLVVMIARKGAYVADVSVKDILDVLEVRSVLEGLAAALAAERITDEELEELELISNNFKKALENDDKEKMIEKDMQFHDKILRSTRNPKLIQIAQSLQEQVQRFRTTYFIEYNQLKTILSDHQEILEAISNREVEKAQKVAQKHVDDLESTIMKFADKIKKE
ncbi:GntR family transcriptional regulator [Crassaminicella thermophila]|uniref:GntR family transcriptional regulator n=1 Tax=Crassaminicella thermophila TaxID=2599308 RepID=A0A5C0SHR8_CRATE|nr:GntR family transcriptional regulator [Crassaminicella thermophila]QEK13276.1 GntR family transcriptional regulator [Crassaminicella thermophila]